jgi:uncharacterized protein YndB with AHSA1/START domain
MANELFIRNTITVQASPAVVWDMLTKPEQTKQYMFGCETVSDWKVGSPLLWRGVHEGKPVDFVKGSIVKLEPNRLLVYTVFDPFSTMPDIPENYLTITYTLTPENGATRLDVSQGDYNKVAEGERRYQESNANGEGWNPLLVQIKQLIESQQA